jgi:hypothetical protein
MKNAPHIMTAVGIAGIPIGTFMACKATLELDQLKQDQEKAFNELEDGKEVYVGKYTAEAYERDRMIVGARGAVKLVKLYLPAGTVLAVSIGLITGGHYILNRRNVALSAAYKILDGAFKSYRERVREEFGQGIDTDLRLNATKRIVGTGDAPEANPTEINAMFHPEKEYARIFDDRSIYWRNDTELNELFLRKQEIYANDQLKARGHVFLNEVYDMLGLPRSKAGCVVGWHTAMGDAAVSFGMHSPTNEIKNDHVDGWSNPPWLLDFNVCGNIYDAI